MQFSVVALSMLSAVAVKAADPISQIGDGQIQATTGQASSAAAPSSSAAPSSVAAISQISDGQIQATGSSSAAAAAPSSSAASSSNGTAIVPQTANGANQLAGGACIAGLVAAGALLI